MHTYIQADVLAKDCEELRDAVQEARFSQQHAVTEALARAHQEFDAEIAAMRASMSKLKVQSVCVFVYVCMYVCMYVCG